MEGEIVEKLRKVLALTTSPVEGEATAAAEHLQRLLTKYNLDIADLELKGHKAPGVKEEEHDLGKAAFKWKLQLADVLAEHYYCVSLTNHVTKKVSFAGRPDNVASLKALYAWIIEQIARIAREDRRRHCEETGEHIDPLRWQVNFGLGAVNRLRDRLRELADKRAASVTETGLVVHHLAEVSDYLEERYGYRKDGRHTKSYEAMMKRHQEKEEAMQELKRTDPEAYYAARPWERPLTPEQQKAKDKQDERERKKNEKRWQKERERYWNRPYRERSPEQIEKEEQEQNAKAAGRRGADKVNLEPFLGEGERAASKGKFKVPDY